MSKTKILLIPTGIIMAFLLLKGVDFLVGILNDNHLIETLFLPNVRIHYHTSEFDTHDKISSQGLRNEEVTLPKPANTIRILAVGDSFTYGWGVKRSDSWPKQLEKTLQGAFSGKKVEVIDAGAPGAGPHKYVHTCQLYVDYLKPDYVLWGVSYEDLNQLGARAIGQIQNTHLNIFLKDNFGNLYGVFNRANFYQNLPKNQEMETQDVWRDQADNLSKKWGLLKLIKMNSNIRKMFLEGLLNPAYVQLAVEEPSFFTIGIDRKTLAVTLTQMKTELSRAENACQNEHTKFLGIVFLPASPFISSKEQNFQRQIGFDVNNQMLSTTLFRDEVKKIASSFHLYFRSSLEELRLLCNDCYFHYDGHMREEGYSIVVKTIAPEIEKLIKGYGQTN